jgi:PGF-pre-PGF domain-containing protein
MRPFIRIQFGILSFYTQSFVGFRRQGKMRRRLVLYALIVTVLVVAVQTALAPRAAASTDWWNENWTWRRPITITTAGDVSAGYQENILLNYDSDMTFDNFQDSRFTWENSTGKYVLSYWFENVNPGENAKVWVKLPVALSAGQSYDNLKWYYGNSSALPAENADNVFQLFDNFSGTAINVDKWTEVDPLNHLSQNDKIIVDGGAGAWDMGLFTKENYARPFIYEFKWRMNATNGSYSGIGVKNTGSSVHYSDFIYWAEVIQNSGKFDYYHGWDRIDMAIGAFTTGTDVWWRFVVTTTGTKIYCGSSLDNLSLFKDDSGYDSTTPIKVGFNNYGQAFDFGNVRIRKYASSEPTVTIGSEVIRPYTLIESWSGTVSAPVSWSAVESWTGTVSTAAPAWQSVESWSGTVSAPDFTVGANPSSSSVQQGSSATVTISVSAVNGYSQTVTLSASGAPSGVSIGFNPGGNVPSFSSSMTVSVGSSASPTTCAITITGTGGDGLVRTASYSLTVTQSQQQQQSPSSPPPDTAQPTLEVIEPTTGSVGENVTVRVKAMDASGIDASSTTVKLDNISTQYTWSSGVVTSSFSKLSPGAHSVEVSVKDASSSHNEASVNISFSVSVQAENVVENAENLAAKPTGAFTVAVGAMGAGENKTVVIENDGIPVSRITLAMDNLPAENVTLSLQVLENAPAGAAENVMIYACIEISFAASENVLASASISFAVPKAWLLANNLNPLAIALYHVENGTWAELQTTKVGEDNANVYYSAASHGFSPFIIGAKALFPTFNLFLPSAPITVENGYAQVTVWVNNPTSSQVQKRLELRFGSYVAQFDVTVQPGDNEGVVVYVPVGEALSETCDVELYDVGTSAMLDSGRVTFASTVKQPEITALEQPPQLPVPLIAAGVVLGAFVGLGALQVVRKLPKTRMLRPKLRGRLVSERRPKVSTKEKYPVLQRYEELLVPAARELSEEGPVVQDYFNLLLPAALEASAKKKVEHTGRAVKPHRKPRAR